MASGASGQKRKKLLHVQAEALVAAIESNPTLVRHAFTGPDGQTLKKTLWGAVARDLNKLGPSKTWSQWKQTWKDMKAKTRKLVALKAREKQINPSAIIVIPALERRVLSIILAKDDYENENEIAVEIPAERLDDEDQGIFENFQGDDVKPYNDYGEGHSQGISHMEDESDGGSSDAPLRRVVNSKTRPKSGVDTKSLERTLVETNKQLREIASVGKEIANAAREITEVNRTMAEVGRNITQALWGLTNALRNSSHGVVLGEMPVDYGEAGRS